MRITRTGTPTRYGRILEWQKNAIAYTATGLAVFSTALNVFLTIGFGSEGFPLSSVIAITSILAVGVVSGSIAADAWLRRLIDVHYRLDPMLKIYHAAEPSVREMLDPIMAEARNSALDEDIGAIFDCKHSAERIITASKQRRERFDTESYTAAIVSALKETASL